MRSSSGRDRGEIQKPMNLRPSLAVLAALMGAILADSQAVASPVTYQLSGGGVSWSTDLTANINYSPAGGGGFSIDPWVGPLSLSVTNLRNNTTDNQTVYCTDIFDDYRSGGVYQLGLLSQTVSLTSADRIDALLSHVRPTDAIEGAAVQAAIWKLENDPGNDNIASGIFSISPDGITGNGAVYQAFIAQTDTYLDKVDSGLWRVQPGTKVRQYIAAPGSGPNQSFSYLSPAAANIPEPASLALLCGGLAVLVKLRLRRGHRVT
jgi:hypothetical protein